MSKETMTPEERQALREKHKQDFDCGPGWACYAECRGTYPCDVIKVLDATELFSETNPKLSDPPTSGTSEPLDPPVSECEHQRYNDCSCDYCWVKDTARHATNFTYCPKCGEKL